MSEISPEDYKLVLDRSKEIEASLELLGSKGRGIHEKLTDLLQKLRQLEVTLPLDMERRIRCVASIRNKVMHVDGYAFDEKQKQYFIKYFGFAIDHLSELNKHCRELGLDLASINEEPIPNDAPQKHYTSSNDNPEQYSSQEDQKHNATCDEKRESGPKTSELNSHSTPEVKYDFNNYDDVMKLYRAASQNRGTDKKVVPPPGSTKPRFRDELKTKAKHKALELVVLGLVRGLREIL